MRGGKVDALVGEVDEGVDPRTGNWQEGTAAVLVDAAADIEAVRSEDAGAAVGSEANEDVAAALPGPALEPADIVAEAARSSMRRAPSATDLAEIGDGQAP